MMLDRYLHFIYSLCRIPSPSVFLRIRRLLETKSIQLLISQSMLTNKTSKYNMFKEYLIIYSTVLPFKIF